MIIQKFLDGNAHPVLFVSLKDIYTIFTLVFPEYHDRHSFIIYISLLYLFYCLLRILPLGLVPN